MKNLVDALMQVESEGNPNLTGDQDLALHAYGILQIRQTVCEDVNTRFGTSFQAATMLGEYAVPQAVFWLYMGIYATEQIIGRTVTDEDRARIWNGGPSAWSAGSSQYAATDGYWAKVQVAMNS